VIDDRQSAMLPGFQYTCLSRNRVALNRSMTLVNVPVKCIRFSGMGRHAAAMVYWDGLRYKSTTSTIYLVSQSPCLLNRNVQAFSTSGESEVAPTLSLSKGAPHRKPSVGFTPQFRIAVINLISDSEGSSKKPAAQEYPLIRLTCAR
jgi:hypothetical protein